ncbi:MAG: two-component regulator propeller domain-containing protein [Ferruginibacter sp.]
MRYFTTLLWGIFILCLALHSPAPAQMQNVRFEKFTMKNGLPNNTINSIAQDKFGFIWLGTQNGLSRHNGDGYTNYYVTGDSNALSSNIIYQLIADSSGKLWILSANGFCYYSYSDNRFHYLDYFKKIKFPLASMIMDEKQIIWFTSASGFGKINTHTLQYSLLHQDSIITGGNLYMDELNRIWIYNKNGLFLYDRLQNRLSEMPGLQQPGIDYLSGFFSRKENEIWVAYNYIDSPGIKLYNKTTGHSQTFFMNNSGSIHEHFNHFILYPFLTGDTILWCNKEKELTLFNLKEKKFLPHTGKDSKDETSLDVGEIFTKYIDRENNLWIGGQNGLAKMNPIARQINSYRITEMFERNAAVSIRKMVKDKKDANIFWVITYGAGIIRYDFNNRRVIKWYRYFTPEKNKEDETGSWNYDAMYDNKGKLWVASGIGLSSYDEKKDEFINQPIEASNKAGDNLVLKMVAGAAGDLWLATMQGLFRYETNTRKLKKIPLNGNDALQGQPIFNLKFSPDGQLILGTKNGVSILDTASGKLKSLYRKTDANRVFSRNYIWGIDSDKDGNIWAATYGGSLWRWNKSDKSYTDFGIKNGLTNTIFRDVYVDSLQTVWASSKDGVFKLPAGDSNFIHYTPNNGLFDIDQSQGRWSIIDNKIFAGYNGGFSVINMYYKNPPQASFPVWISGMKIFDEAVYFAPGSYRDNSLQLKPAQNFISFEFTGLDYTQTENLKYAYKLEGADKDWINIGSRRFVTYSNLAAGDYTMMLKAINGEGQWSNQQDMFKFHLPPVFWKSWWFRLLALFLITIGIVSLFRYKVASVKKDASFRQRIMETEMIALRTQLNPHFIFNSLSSIENLMMKNKQALAIDYLNKFALLLRTILESSRTALVPFLKDMQAIELYVELEQLRLNKSFTYSIHIDPDLQEGDYKVPPLLIQPFVENAILHGLAALERNVGLLSISTSLQNDMIHYEIKDNGIGRRQAQLYKEQNKSRNESIGVNLSEERIRNLNEQQEANGKLEISDLYDEQGKPAGTQVDITIKAT